MSIYIDTNVHQVIGRLPYPHVRPNLIELAFCYGPGRRGARLDARTSVGYLGGMSRLRSLVSTVVVDTQGWPTRASDQPTLSQQRTA
jgi:hypothetical protein